MPLKVMLVLGFFMFFLCYIGLKAIFASILEFHIPMFIIGFIILFVGLSPLLIYFRRKFIKHKIMKFNVILNTSFLDVIDAEYNFIGHAPWVVRSQWFDEKNNLIYQFKSSPLSVDPSEYLYDELKIPVFINPDNPKEYYMDLARIPDLKRVLYDN